MDQILNVRNKVILSHVMQPSQANPAGNVHGGEIMKMMDTAAAAAATKYSKGNCVTARVDELQFSSSHLRGCAGNMPRIYRIRGQDLHGGIC